MLNQLARFSRSRMLLLTAALLATAGSVAGCENADSEPATDDGAVKNVQITAGDLEELSAGERVSLDMRASGVLYHLVFTEPLDFSRIDLVYGSDRMTVDGAMESLFSSPYDPRQAATQRFVIAADPASFPELSPADVDALKQEKMITREHASNAPNAQPQSIGDCVEQTIYTEVSITINGTVYTFTCAFTILACGGEAACSEVHSFGGHDYLFCNNQESWADAEAYCDRFHMDLVTLNDANEEGWVYGTANIYSTQKWWIGLNDRASEGSFVWESGEPVGYTNWYAWEPNNAGGNEDCGQLNRFYPDKGWNDEPCSLHFRYICESN